MIIQMNTGLYTGVFSFQSFPLMTFLTGAGNDGFQVSVSFAVENWWNSDSSWELWFLDPTKDGWSVHRTQMTEMWPNVQSCSERHEQTRRGHKLKEGNQEWRISAMAGYERRTWCWIMFGLHTLTHHQRTLISWQQRREPVSNGHQFHTVCFRSLGW